MTFPEFLTTLRQADEQAKDAPWLAEGQPHQQAIYHPYSADERKALNSDHEGEHVVLGGESYLDEEDAHAIALLRNTLPQTIAIMEVARTAIEDAPHDKGRCTSAMHGHKCNCWKSAALAEIDALAAKTP